MLHHCISASLRPGGEWFARPGQSCPGARIRPLLPQTRVLSPLLIALPLPHAHLEGTLLPLGFFLGLGLIYLAALAVDRLAAAWRLPGAAAVLLLGLLIPTEWLTQAQPLGPLQVETLHRVSLALLIFYAGLKTDLRRIRGMTAAGLRLGCGGVLITLAITALAFLLLAPLLLGGLPPAAVVLAVSTVVTLLGFGLVAGVLQAQPHGDHQALHGVLASRLPDQLGAVGLHVIAGLLAGLIVGAVAPRLIDALVRSGPMLLLVAVALSFVAYGFGQLLGGGGLLAVFLAGVLLSNGRYRIGRFEQQTLGRVMHPLNTAAEITVLPLGLALAIVLPLARLLAVWAVMPAPTFPWKDRLVVAGCGLRAASLRRWRNPWGLSCCCAVCCRSAPRRLRLERRVGHQRRDAQLLSPLGQGAIPALLPALGQQRCADPSQLQAVGRRLPSVYVAGRRAFQAPVQQIGPEQHGAAGPAQLHHIHGAHRRFSGRCGRAAAHHMPEVVGVAHALVQPGVVAIAAGLQHRIGQRLAAGIGEPAGVDVAEALRRKRQQLGWARPGPPIARADQRCDRRVAAQGGAGGIGHWRGVAAGEQIEAMAQVVRVCGQGREIGGQVQQLAAQG